MSLALEGKLNQAISVILEKNNKRKGFVYYKKDIIDELDNLNENDIDDEMLEVYYGKTLTRTKKSKQQLRNELLEKIAEMNNDEKRMFKQLRAPQGTKFFPLPLTNAYDERDTFYISGQAGSGKSRFVMRLVHYYYSLGIKNIFVISSKDGDKEKYISLGVRDYLNIDDLVDEKANNQYYKELQVYKEKKIKLRHLKKQMDLDTKDIVDLEIELEKMKPVKPTKIQSESYKPTKDYYSITNSPSLFIYDDWETLPASQKKKCGWLIDYQLINERSRGVNVIVINHKSTNGLASGHQLNESQKFIIFSRNLFKNYHYLLHRYIGLSNQEIIRIKHILKTSNYVMIDRLNKYVISEKLVYLL